MNEYVSCFELLSDYKSFKLTIPDASVMMGYLMHFNHLEIVHKELFYQRNTGIRQRKSTKHPIRKLRKKIQYTGELLHYLVVKQYDVILYDLRFVNGWRVKMTSNFWVTIYTNSQEQRNDFFNKIICGFGYDMIPLNTKLLNITYSINYHSTPVAIGIDPTPDEFWLKEEVEEWKRNYNS